MPTRSGPKVDLLYEEAKTLRILTAVAFLSAFSALVYFELPYKTENIPKHPTDLAGHLTVAYHLLFGTYSILIGIGACIVLIASHQVPVATKSLRKGVAVLIASTCVLTLWLCLAFGLTGLLRHV